MPRALVTMAVAICLWLVGCGGSEDEPPERSAIGQGRAVVGCKTAFGGKGPATWRGHTTTVGQFGVFGTGRDFRTAQKVPVANFAGLERRGIKGPVLSTKTPFVVEGKKPVEVAIDPVERVRAGLAVGPFDRANPYAELRFIPCRDQPRTAWAAGWALRDREPVMISVSQEDAPELRRPVGRP